MVYSTTHLQFKRNNMSGRGRNQRNKINKFSKGTSKFGICTCPQCNYSVTHKRGVPCFTLLCPKCNIPLIKQAQSENCNKHQITNTDTKISNFPIINTELCIGCGACIDICPVEAIYLENGKAKLTTSKCKKCKACVNACPVEAIT